VINRVAIVPDWLAEVVRPKPAPLPWPDMVRAVLAICLPLSAGILTGHRSLGLLPAMGGLMGVMVDNGGPYLARLRRVGVAALFGGAPGLAIGAAIHGRGWIAVLALVLVAGVSAIISALGDVGSITGLQLLVYASLGLGPLGALRPWWHQAAGFGVGVVWALLLIVPGWLLEPRAAEQRAVADVYHALARALRAIGTPGALAVRRDVTAALNRAYDMLLTGRTFAAGRSRSRMRLTAVLNVSHLVAEATTTLRSERRRPPALVTETLERLGDAVAGDGPVPVIPPPWGTSPGTVALRDALVRLASLLSGGGYAGTRPILRPSARDRLAAFADQLRVGTVGLSFTIRLMACIGVAAYLSEVLVLQRSYWVVLTTAIVLKPDYGSVFARALQRGIGTIVGAVLGAAILAVVPYGPWLLVPFGILAALLPYGRARNFGLSATFLTPVVVLLIDLLADTGWRLAEARLLDTVLGCLVVLVVGYLPWPMSWQAHLPGRLAATMRAVAEYLVEALSDPVAASTPGPPPRSRMRRRTSRAISNLRAEFQRVMSEPASVRRRAAALWPAVVGLEDVMDAVTALAVSAGKRGGAVGGAPAPAPEAVRRVARALTEVADALDSGSTPVRDEEPLPPDEALTPVTDAVRSVLGALAPHEDATLW
jgi:uncharacterized membrane protein YccC